MLAVISPAKTLDFEAPANAKKTTRPLLLKDAGELVERMREFEPDDLCSLMGISEKLGQLNAQRYLDWHTPFNKSNAKPAIEAFKGDVYTGLEAGNFSQEDFAFAQDHLRILSGLYGVLRPLDLMQPYRLEMGTKLDNDRGDNLYQFWGDRLSKEINKQLKKNDSSLLVNLASNEYFNAIDNPSLKANIVTPVFKDFKNGKYKIISFFAKKARGLMAAYIIQNRLTTVEQLKAFTVGGYHFDQDQSDENTLVFLRKEAA